MNIRNSWRRGILCLGLVLCYQNVFSQQATAINITVDTEKITQDNADEMTWIIWDSKKVDKDYQIPIPYKGKIAWGGLSVNGTDLVEVRRIKRIKRDNGERVLKWKLKVSDHATIRKSAQDSSIQVYEITFRVFINGQGKGTTYIFDPKITVRRGGSL